jgi:diguanylate cyclase (GGDEF)-like protein
MKPLLQALSRDLDAEVDRAELRGLARNTADGAWLLLVLAGLYLLTPGGEILRPVLMVMAFATFAAFMVLLRFLPQFRRQTRLRVGLELLAMTTFITAFLYSLDTHASALLILYLLPVVIGALTLGRWATFALTAVSVAGFLFAALFRDPAAALAARDLVKLGIAIAPFLLVAYVTALLAHEINTAMQRIRSLSETDELTGLCNLRAFSRLHRLEHERAVRHHRAYTIIVMDLNGLKQINDSYGHEVGDRAIVLLANVIARLIRSTDAAARLGGDEFVLLLSESDAEQSVRVAHRIRSSVERCTIAAAGRMLRLSVSVGSATFPEDGEDPRAVIAAADRAMYLDKRTREVTAAERQAPQAEVV